MISRPDTMVAAQVMRRTRRPRDGAWRVSPTLPRVLVALLLALAAGALALTLRAYVQGAGAYVDNGDGYYLYAARRLAQGAVLYRDVLGTQPPLVYLLGAAVFKLGDTLGTIRLASAAMRVLATALVFTLGRRLCGDSVTAALAALTYTLLPLGLTWDRSFDVNPPLTLLTLLALWPLLRGTARAAVLGGVLAALALFTKNLYLPILAVTLAFMVLRQRRLLRPYALGLGAGLLALSAALTCYAGVRGLHDAFLGQDSSPLNLAWFAASLRAVVALEGGAVLVAAVGAGLALMMHERPKALSLGPPASSGQTQGAGIAPWFLAGSCAVLLATLKEGTAWPVFQIAEPAVALLAAYAATWPWRAGRWRTLLSARPNPLACVALAAPFVLAYTLWGLAATGGTMLSMTGGDVGRVAAMVRTHAAPGTTIVAPPYYAVLTGTTLPGDAADTYILAQRARRGDRWATALVRRIDADLAARRIPIVLTDLRLAAIGPLMSTLQVYYRPVYADALPPALHVVVWLPR